MKTNFLINSHLFFVDFIPRRKFVLVKIFASWREQKTALWVSPAIRWSKSPPSGKQLLNSDEMSLALKLDSISLIWLRAGYMQVDTEFTFRERLLCQRGTQDCGFYNYIDYSEQYTSSTWLEEDCHKITFNFGFFNSYLKILFNVWNHCSLIVAARYPCHLSGIYHTLGRTFLFPVHRRLAPVPSVIKSQLFPLLHDFYNFMAAKFSFRGRNKWQPPDNSSPDVNSINVGFYLQNKV